MSDRKILNLILINRRSIGYGTTFGKILIAYVAMSILAFKALHIVGFVAWFAGLFYLVRLFVYHAEALEKPDPERSILVAQYAKMEQRLFGIITRPAMIITFVAGIAMLMINPDYLQEGWMHIKLTLVILLLLTQQNKFNGHLAHLLKSVTHVP